MLCRLQAVLSLAVQTLIAVAEASDKAICLWILQALLACANAAGLAFVPHVKPTLGLAQVTGSEAGRDGAYASGRTGEGGRG